MMYFSVSFTFGYTMVMGYSNLFGAYATVVTRMVSQAREEWSIPEVPRHL